jgi:hypothetical protein
MSRRDVLPDRRYDRQHPDPLKSDRDDQITPSTLKSGMIRTVRELLGGAAGRPLPAALRPQATSSAAGSQWPGAAAAGPARGPACSADDGAEEHLAAILRCFEEGQAQLEAARTRAVWGHLLRDRGDLTAAREHLEKAAAQFEASGLTEELERTRHLLAGLAN